MFARTSILAVLVLGAVPLGCSGGPEMALVDPDKYEMHNCAQLERDLKPLAEHARELRALKEKAARDPGGAVVATLAYGPDHLATAGNIQLIEAAARERNCDPPVTMTGALLR